MPFGAVVAFLRIVRVVAGLVVPRGVSRPSWGRWGAYL